MWLLHFQLSMVSCFLFISYFKQVICCWRCCCSYNIFWNIMEYLLNAWYQCYLNFLLSRLVQPHVTIVVNHALTYFHIPLYLWEPDFHHAYFNCPSLDSTIISFTYNLIVIWYFSFYCPYKDHRGLFGTFG